MDVVNLLQCTVSEDMCRMLSKDEHFCTTSGENTTCVQGYTNGTNGIPISFMVLPMVPLGKPRTEPLCTHNKTSRHLVKDKPSRPQVGQFGSCILRMSADSLC